MNPLHIEIPGPPVPKQRPRAAKRKYGSADIYMFTPKKTVDYEKAVRHATVAAMHTWKVENKRPWPVEKSRFSVNIFLWMADNRTRDLDNCVKSLTDAMNKVVYADDRQIDELYAVRDYDKTNPRAVVVVRVL